MAAEHSPLVLIADDEPTARLILQETLELAGFRVVLASDGIEALACYKDHSPDLILLDLQMPNLDGFSVCRQIREVESDRKTPIIILTGQDDDDSIARAFELGATDFVNKPIIWPLLVGPHRAKEYLMSGKLADAAEAERIGLVNHVVPADELQEQAMAFAQRIAAGAPLAIQYTKLAVNKLVKDALNVAFDTSTALEIVTFQSDDHREALEALREKRKPVFKGR